jgi:hypothetical protein
MRQSSVIFASAIAVALATLTVAFLEFGLSAGQAQGGFCEYQHNHCLGRCASRELNRRCFPRCRVQYRHCKAPSPHLGELIGTR